MIIVEFDNSLLIVSPTGKILLSGSKAFRKTVALKLSSRWIFNSTSSNIGYPDIRSRGFFIKGLTGGIQF
jgi:hypothetical protein